MSHRLTGLKSIQACSVEEIAAAVLYEGYILYPYRASAAKNHHRFHFGTLSPPSWSEFQKGTDACSMRTECLIHGEHPHLDIRVRFLHPMERQIGKLAQAVPEWNLASLPDYEPVASLRIDDQMAQTWREVVEREIRLDHVSMARDSSPSRMPFQFPATRQVEPLRQSDGQIIGLVIRQQESVSGAIEIRIRQLQADLYLASIVIRNETSLEMSETRNRDEVMRFSLASTHTILESSDGQFVSLLEPPGQYAAAAQQCQNEGCWPVLVGDKGDRSVMLSSPIILYDYPQIAAESDGDFFDGCEIDEMLALRVMTLSDDEKQQMRGVDDRAAAILERTDTEPEDYLMKLHATMKPTSTHSQKDEEMNQDDWNDLEDHPTLQSVRVLDHDIKVGDRVRLRPKKGGDIMDMALDSQIAIVESIEQDYEENIHFAVVLEIDPGRDFGMLRQPGHRFFFTSSEIEPVERVERDETPRES